MRKVFLLNDRDLSKFSKVYLSNSFDCYTVIRIHGARIMFFHNDLPGSDDGLNRRMIDKFKELKENNLVDYFVCCFPEETGIVEYCWFGAKAYGLISVRQKNNLEIVLSCKKSGSR